MQIVTNRNFFYVLAPAIGFERLATPSIDVPKGFPAKEKYRAAHTSCNPGCATWMLSILSAAPIEKLRYRLVEWFNLRRYRSTPRDAMPLLGPHRERGVH
jgi:hypothetical protein